jgi:aryl-alcohol dehydrogenase-like predicted oxidoreductase
LEYRELGSTGEKVSTIGIGAWHIGDGSQAESDEQIRAIRRGLELGMNLIDTAERYGRGKSEQLVAEAIKGRRDSVFIATKVAGEHLGHSDVVEACDASLRRLGTRHIDLYQVHWPNPKVPIRETMAGMEELVRTGKIRYIGVSNFNVKEVDDAMDALPKSEIVSNQVEYSLSNRAAESDVLTQCRDKGMTLIAYSPLAMGAIPKLQIPPSIKKYNLTVPQIMLNWVTRHPEVIAIPKAAQTKHMEENVSSVSVRFSKSEYASISESV